MNQASNEAQLRAGLSELKSLSRRVLCAYRLWLAIGGGLRDMRLFEHADAIYSELYRKAFDLGFNNPLANPDPFIMTNSIDDADWFYEGTNPIYESWEAGQSSRKAEMQDVRKKVHFAFVEAKLKFNDWEGLGLPSPEFVLGELEHGRDVCVGGHSLHPDVGIVWYTNPYGVDGVFCSVPTLDGVQAFMTEIARGHICGLAPECELDEAV